MEQAVVSGPGKGNGRLVEVSEDDRVDEASHASQQRVVPTLKGTTGSTRPLNVEDEKAHKFIPNPFLPEDDRGQQVTPKPTPKPRFRPMKRHARGDEASHASQQRAVPAFQGATSRSTSRRNVSSTRRFEIQDHKSRQPSHKFLPNPLLPHHGRGRPPTRRFKPKENARKRSSTRTATAVGVQAASIEGVQLGRAAAGVADRASTSRQQQRQPANLEDVLPTRGGGGGSARGRVSSSSGRGAFGTGGGNGRPVSRPRSTDGWSRSWVTIDKTPSSIAARVSRASTKLQAQRKERKVVPCPEAIRIALAQADVDGGGWYTSTMQLACASLGYCRECRRVPVVGVWVDHKTPLRLVMDAVSVKKYQKKTVDTWVPSISYSALRRVTWMLPVSWLSLTTEVFARVESLAIGDEFDCPVADVHFPPNLKSLGLGRDFNRTMKQFAFPPGLQELDLGEKFNQRLGGVKWPSSLTRLELSYNFNRPIEGAVFPPSLRYLSFRRHFNQHITKVSWPQDLQELSFEMLSAFDQPIADVSWPRSMKKMTFGFYFNQPVDRVSWPGMVELTFGYHFNQSVENVLWPASLTKLTFGKMFNGTIDPSSLPSSLERLTMLRPGAVLPVCPGVQVSGVPG